MGDFNLNLLHIDTNSSVLYFIDNIYSTLLFPTIHKPTRITKTTATLIDNIFVNTISVKPFGLIMKDLSDHFPIFTVCDLTYKSDKCTQPLDSPMQKIDFVK